MWISQEIPQRRRKGDKKQKRRECVCVCVSVCLCLCVQVLLDDKTQRADWKLCIACARRPKRWARGEIGRALECRAQLHPNTHTHTITHTFTQTRQALHTRSPTSASPLLTSSRPLPNLPGAADGQERLWQDVHAEHHLRQLHCPGHPPPGRNK